MRKHCKRKRIYTATSPLAFVLEGVKPTPEAMLDKLRTRELSAIEAFRTGVAGLQEWTDINTILSMAETMARGGIGPEALGTCEQAQTALIRAAKHFEATGRMVLTAEGLQAIRSLYEYHDLQRQSVSRGELEKWLTKAMGRVRSKAPEVVDIAEAA